MTQALDRVTTSRKAKEEGAVHLAPPPRECRLAPDSVLWLKRKAAPGVDGIMWADYEEVSSLVEGLEKTNG